MARARQQPDDPLVARIRNETKAGEDELATRVKQYDRAYEVYRANSPRPKGLEPWRSFLRGKYAMQKIDTAMVNMVQGAPRCKVLPRTPGYAIQAQAFQRLFDYFGDRDHLEQKDAVTVQQALVYGVTVGKTHWLFQTGTVTRRGFDPHTGSPTGPYDQPVVLRDGPSYEPWDVYDAWWEPNARSVDNAEWVALRSWCSKQYLEQNACTTSGEHNPIDCTGLYHNIEALFQAGPGTRRGASAQDRLLGGDMNLRKDRFEITEYWRDDRLTVVGNCQILLRDQPNPHWHQRKPVVIASCRPDLFRIQGIPETELIDDFQQALWTLENLRMENLHLTTWRGFTARETMPDPWSVVIKPRAIVLVTDHDDLKPIEVPPLPPEAYEEEQVLLARMDDVTGITPYTTGAALSSVNQNTATGISILNSAASMLLKFKAGQVRGGVWQPTFEQWGEDIQQYLEGPVYVRIVGQGGDVQFAQVGAQDVVGEYDYKFEGSDESLSKAQERQDALGLLQSFAPLAQLGIINWKPIMEKVARAFGFENPAELVQPAQQQPPAAPFQQAPHAQQGQALANGAGLPAMAQSAVMQGGTG